MKKYIVIAVLLASCEDGNNSNSKELSKKDTADVRLGDHDGSPGVEINPNIIITQQSDSSVLISADSTYDYYRKMDSIESTKDTIIVRRIM